jgi:hypothetical protein
MASFPIDLNEHNALQGSPASSSELYMAPVVECRRPFELFGGPIGLGSVLVLRAVVTVGIG